MHGASHGGGGAWGPAGMYGGPHGIAAIAFGANASIDLIGGPAEKFDGLPPELSSSNDAFPDKDVLVLNGRHGDINLLDLFLFAMDEVGFQIVRVPFSICGRRATPDKGWVDEILPVKAWLDSEEGDRGPLPDDIGDRGGKSRMFRYFYQVKEKPWWHWLWQSDLAPDPAALCFLEAAGLTWYSAEFGDYRSELLLKLHGRKAYDSVLAAHLPNTPALKSHRKAQWLCARKVNVLVRAHQPSKEAQRARRLYDEPIGASQEGAVPNTTATIDKPGTVGYEITLPGRSS